MISQYGVRRFYFREVPYPWDDLSLPFFSPLSHLRVNLVSEFGFDLASITGEEREETLCPAVDDIDLV